MKKVTLTLGLTISFLFSHAQLTWLKLPDYPGQGRLGVNSLSIGSFGYLGMGYDGSIATQIGINTIRGQTHGLKWLHFPPLLGCGAQ